MHREARGKSALLMGALISLLTGCESDAATSRAGEAPAPKQTSAALSSPWGRSGMNIDEHFLQLAEELPGFGGLYLEHGQPVVYLTDLGRSEEVRSALGPQVRSLLEQEHGPEAASLKAMNIRFVKGRHDFKRLHGWHGALQEALRLPGVVFTDVDESRNVVRIGVSSDASGEELRRLSEAAGMPREALLIEKVEPFTNADSLQETWWPPVGGLQIQNDSGSICTLGYNVNHTLGRGFITNSHCTNSQGGTEGTKFYQANKSFLLGYYFVGTERLDPNYNLPTTSGCPSGWSCRRSDAALVLYEPLKTLGRLGNLAMPYGRCGLPQTHCELELEQSASLLYDIVNDTFRTHVAVGQKLDKIGRTTGHTKGEVTKTCINTSNGSHLLLCQDAVAAGVDSGDSGAPVFVHNTNGNIEAVGLLWGSNTSHTEFAFSLLSEVQGELGSFSVR